MWLQISEWTDIYDCVQFGADPNKNLDLVNLNLVS